MADIIYTPQATANRMATLLNVGPGMKVLDPGSGLGALAQAVHALQPTAEITCVDNDTGTYAGLEGLSWAHVVKADFLNVWRVLLPAHFDRVIMTPPFSEALNTEHVTQAFSLLKPGGRLVAAVNRTFKTRSGAKWDAFRALHAQNLVSEETIANGTFRENNVNIVTSIIVWAKS